MPRVLPALVCLALLSVAGCTGDEGDQDPPAAEPSAVSTPLAELDTASLAVAREELCGDLPPAAVEAALDGPVEATDHYDNGDPAALTDAVRDVSHEFGCVFAGADGAQARAWVFVPPVTAERAGELVRELGRVQGCRPVADAPAFGSPTLARVCDASAPGAPVEASYRGLFGDAWLSCSVSAVAAEPDALLERADAWCANVVTAAAAG